ncbi:OVARIAN TUMOR DOMAIN-containing deubiquitinating enzyme 12 isoform X1 [Oryza sativa Japonica Group]|uniref:OVARIAN TUMOR DOMAIN-containing deubiquitinating enzyme 12 isoform X1 n=1 Tax=Oryza sativa subsp. japonica TaxID=39947 RepID=UPI00339BC746
MVVYEQDPDVLRWSLHLLLPPAAALHYQQRTSSVDCDEMIAHALQEELSYAQSQSLSSSILHLPPSAPPLKEDEQDDAPPPPPPFSSCSTPADYTNTNNHNAHDCLIEFVDDFSALDGQVGKRLHDMIPIPHVPKTNGDIPSVDEAFSDHQRLLHRLELYDLAELKVEGDGNCQHVSYTQFRALSDQFYRTTEHHRFVRQQIVKQLESYPEIYAGYVPMDYREYLKKMIKHFHFVATKSTRNGEWGDHVTLQAAADSYGVKIFILTSFRDTCYIEILPVVQKSERVICLSFWAEVHYNSIYPEGELPVMENKRKRWWHF